MLRYRQACLADQLFGGVPVEESQVRPIEESLFRVVESPLEQAQAKCAVGDIGDRHNRDAPRGQETGCTLQDRCRVAQVFEHIEREDDVEGLATECLKRFLASRSATMTRSQTCEAALAACSSCSMPHTVQPRFFSARATDPSAAPRSNTRLPAARTVPPTNETNSSCRDQRSVSSASLPRCFLANASAMTSGHDPKSVFFCHRLINSAMAVRRASHCDLSVSKLLMNVRSPLDHRLLQSHPVHTYQSPPIRRKLTRQGLRIADACTVLTLTPAPNLIGEITTRVLS